MFTRRESLQQYMQLYPITSLLIASNIAMFVFTMLSGGLSAQHLYHLGGMVTTPPEQGAEVWRWFTSMFLHGSFMHLLMNMFSLYVFAPALERMLGRVRYALFYLATGIAASAVSAYFASDIVVSIGASGAIYGVFGGLLSIALRDKWRISNSDKQILYAIIGIGLISGFFFSNVNVLGHFGGLVVGFAILYWRKKRTLQ